MSNTQENLPENPAEKGHILVVDDDRRICELVSRYLEEHGFITISASSAREARLLLQAFEVDAAVVDVMMPGETGLELTGYVRDEVGIPVLLLTALGETQDRIKGFQAGADDYLPKPFEPMELVMRLQAILRRTQRPGLSGSSGIRIGGWVFDEGRSALVQGDEFVKLTQIEVNLLKALAQHAGQPVDRERLAQLCQLEGGERTIDVQVTRLRKKIEADTKNPRYLQTVRGKGYVLHSEKA